MESILGTIFEPKFTRKQLTALAKMISKELHLSLDRDAQRYKDALICWFVEHWKLINLNASTLIEKVGETFNSSDTLSSQIPADFDEIFGFDQHGDLNDDFFEPFN
jgi:hypothetical protein